MDFPSRFSRKGTYFPRIRQTFSQLFFNIFSNDIPIKKQAPRNEALAILYYQKQIPNSLLYCHDTPKFPPREC